MKDIATPVEDQTAVKERSARPSIPLTGQEYLESLNDGREVWIYGEKVKDVTKHPAFRNSCRMIARLYDALHDPAKKEVLTMPTEDGGFTHRFYRAPRNVEEQVASRDAIAEWARTTYGWMGRSPDYKASFLATLGANNDFYKPFHENAKRWYYKAQEKTYFLNHAIIHPPVDRDKAPDEVGDVYVHVDEETDGGLIVSGAKVVATGSALTHYSFIAHHGAVPLQTKKFAIVFAIPTSAPGLKFICRGSYEYAANLVGSPFDYPLSSRLDENDAILVLDRAFVPWEDVFIYGDVETANNFFPKTGFIPRFLMHGCTRLAVKLDFITGLLLMAVEATGSKDYRSVQANIGEVIAWRNCFWGLSEAMARNAKPWTEGTVLPDTAAAQAYQVLSTEAYPAIRHLVEKTVASGLIYMNSHAADFNVPELRRYLDRFVRGSNGYTSERRVKLMKMLWDAVGSEFGSRHELYEVNYTGNHEDIRRQALSYLNASGIADELKAFAESAMAEYDLNGWTVSDLITPGDVNVIRRK